MGDKMSSMSSARTATATVSTKKTFCDLPVEIRLAVYKHFQNIPTKPTPQKSTKDDLWTVKLNEGPSSNSAEGDKAEARRHTENWRVGVTATVDKDPWQRADDERARKATCSDSYDLIANTRQALLLTCKKVHEEW